MWTYGLAQSIWVTVPVSVNGFARSNFAARVCCARSDMAPAATVSITAATATRLLITSSPIRAFPPSDSTRSVQLHGADHIARGRWWYSGGRAEPTDAVFTATERNRPLSLCCCGNRCGRGNVVLRQFPDCAGQSGARDADRSGLARPGSSELGPLRRLFGRDCLAGWPGSHEQPLRGNLRGEPVHDGTGLRGYWFYTSPARGRAEMPGRGGGSPRFHH